jgi:PQQ-like domain
MFKKQTFTGLAKFLLVTALSFTCAAAALSAQTPTEQSEIQTPAGVSWPMFKNQATRLANNPLETTINSQNARFLSLSWIGILGDIVDTSSPAIANGVVYVGSFDGNLYAFNANGCGASSCNPLWVGTMDNQFATVSSPAVVGGFVYIGSADHKLFVFPAGGCGHNTCAPLWTGITGGAIDSGPLVANGKVYVGSEDHRLYVFNGIGCGHATCPPLWTVNTGGGVNSSPAIANGVVYFGSQDGKLYAVSASGCGSLSCRPLWTAQVGQSIFASSPMEARRIFTPSPPQAVDIPPANRSGLLRPATS